MSWGVGRRCSSDPTLLWLWRKLVATAPIRPLNWEPPYATEVALEKAKRQKKKNQLHEGSETVIIGAIQAYVSFLFLFFAFIRV